jgi:hypothetical protein
VSACRCDDPAAARYGPDQVCWHCWQAAHGGDGTIPEPEGDEFEFDGWPTDEPDEPPQRSSPAEVRELIEALGRALGPAVCTPEWVMSADYRQTRQLERAKYRVFRWRCPSCGAGEDDPLQLYRPFAVDSDGRVSCGARGCHADRLEATLRGLLGGAP